ncbi:MAG: transglycosylase domain-containing protein, partial [Saprospiraceae bacterium]
MTTKEIRQANKGKYKKRVIFLWVLWLVGVLSVFFLFFFLSMSKDLPSVEDLQNPKDLLATEIVANDGSILGRFYIKNRVKVRYDELPENLVNSLISTEDKRFYDHAAVDLEALARVVKGIVTGTTSQGGGSTITQQLAKMQYSNRNIKGGKIARAYKLFTTKLKEWITAVQLERQYTKEEILMMYLNEFDFLNGAIGIKSASETYFAKQPKELDNQEAAVLVGMLKNPSMFNVKRFPQRAWDRHLTVLRLTRDAGHLPDEEFQKYMDTPDDEQFVPLTFSRKSHSEGIAPYFREELRYEVKKILAKIKKEKGREYDVHRDGLRVYTTLNPRMQIHAEASVRKNMSAKQKKFFKEWKGKDPWTHGAASKKEKEMRQKSFLRVLRESERFKAHREQFLDETLDVIAKSHDLRLKDYDIQRMVSEEEEGGVLTSLKNQGLLTKKKASKYRKIMK